MKITINDGATVLDGTGNLVISKNANAVTIKDYFKQIPPLSVQGWHFVHSKRKWKIFKFVELLRHVWRFI